MTRDGEAGRGQIRKGLEHFGREVRLHLKGQRNQNDIIQRAFQVGEGDRRGRSSQTKGLVSYQDTPVGGKTEALNKEWGSGKKEGIQEHQHEMYRTMEWRKVPSRLIKIDRYR